MAKFELVMPKMGESIIEATILKWTKKVGDSIEAEESVLEIATDKVDSEVPSPVEGVLVEILYKEGEVVPVGKAIAIIETVKAEASAQPAAQAPDNTQVTKEESATTQVPYVPTPAVISAEPVHVSNANANRFYSPLVLNIAREEKISMEELEKIAGTGRESRVTKKDILEYVANRNAAPQVVAAPVVAAVVETPKVAAPSVNGASNSNGIVIPEKKFAHGSNYEIVEMDRMRKMIAENMVYSKHVSPHVTSFVEADVTNIVLWRNKVKGQFEKQYGEKLTFTPIFVLAIAKALREMPRVNVSVEGDKIYLKKDINVGVAVATPDDNLIVPVIKNTDRLNLVGITAAVNDLATRARNRKLKPDELESGTYTVSNVGTFGNVMGTPIIMQPQAAIMATGAIRKLPAVVETPTGDVIAIRHKMFLSHSYDHRIIDGALGGKFVRRVADILEAWDLNTEI
ncbi:MAG: dihydrolipoamide acetyltransferase family protein [Bacteroidia bacterium]